MLRTVVQMENSLLERAKRWLLCERLNLHVGYPESVGGWMCFWCTRCESYNHPLDLETTQRISERLLEEGGYRDE